jgi:hypothetical protein
MAFDNVKKEVGGQILAMPVHSTVYQFARALGGTHADAMQTLKEHNKMPEAEKAAAQERMAAFLAKRSGPREAIRRAAANGVHAYALAGPDAQLGCGGCGQVVGACRCAEQLPDPAGAEPRGAA